MKLSYDTKYDVLYIRFREAAGGVTTRQLTDEIAIDLDERGRLVGIEVLAASTHIDLQDLLPVELERTGT